MKLNWILTNIPLCYWKNRTIPFNTEWFSVWDFAIHLPEA